MYRALDDKTLKCTTVFCRVYKGTATGLRHHQDHSIFTWRITGKAMGKTQRVKFVHKTTGASFTLLHLPGTWYAGEEHLVSNRHDNEWEHMVIKEDRTDDPIVSLIVDFGQQKSIFHDGSKWLQDFKPWQLPLPASVSLHPLLFQGTYTHMTVMEKSDQSVLGKHRDSEKTRLSKLS